MALRTSVEQIVKQIEGAKALDPLADQLATAVNAATAAEPIKNAVTGTWLGHPVHPMLVAIPIGAWSAASILDLVGGRSRRPAADWLVGFGLLSAVPTAATGAGSWSDLFGEDRRIGLVHAGANVTATTFYTASLIARRRGRRGRAKMLGLLGLGAITAGGWLGGHLTYRLGVGVDHTAFEDASDEWTTVASITELAEGKPLRVDVGGTPVLLVRQGSRTSAIAATCSHESGPLDEGKIRDGCVECPWHGSVFRLDDGSVVRGPATAPQPRYQVRQVADEIQVRAGAG